MERCSCCGAPYILHGGVCDLCFAGDDPDDYLSSSLLCPHDYDDME